MYLAEKQKQDAKILKELITFASTLILKDQTSADQHESVKSVTYANNYISAIEGTLPIENGVPCFTTSELREYNAIPDNTAYFIDCYRRNSLYIGNSDRRLKEVSEAASNTNYGNLTAPYRGNVYEANSYYRMLFYTYGCDPYDARRAQDMSIIAYNTGAVTSNIDLFRFNKIYDECRNLFMERLFNKAFEYTNTYRELVNFLLIVMTITRYLDEKLADLTIYKNYTAKDLRNLFYSFGFFNDSIIPSSFKEDVAKALYKLINAKATDAAFDIVVDDIFKSESIKIYKYVLVKEIADSEYKSKFFSDDTIAEPNPDSVSLKFYKIPYGVKDSIAYIKAHRGELSPVAYGDFVSNDRFWFPNEDDQGEAQLKANKDVSVLETKYISVTYKNDNLVSSAEKLALFFAMLHHVNAARLNVESSAMRGNVSLFDLMIAFVYTRALLITKLNPENIAVGNCYSTDPYSNNREFKHFIIMLNSILTNDDPNNPSLDPLKLYDFASKKVTNIIQPDPTSEDPISKAASVVCAVEDSSGYGAEEFPSRDELFARISSIPDLIREFKSISEFLDDMKYAVENIEQGLEYYSPDFVKKTPHGNYAIDYGILSQKFGNVPTFSASTIDRLEKDIIRVISSGDTEHILLKYGVGDGASEVFYNRLKTYGLNNYFEMKNALHIKEALIASEDNISNENYAGEDTYEKYLKENQPEFTARIMRIINESDDPLPEIEMISSSLASEIDAIFRRYELNDISFTSLDSLAIAAFASSLIAFIKSITLQIRSSADNTLEVEINEGSEDKMTLMDGLFYETEQQRILFDGSDLDDSGMAVFGSLTLKDSPHFSMNEMASTSLFKDGVSGSTDSILESFTNSPLNKPEVLRNLDIPDEDDDATGEAGLESILHFREEVFAHIVAASGIQPDEYDFDYILYKEASFISRRAINERFPLRSGEGFIKPPVSIIYFLKVNPSGTVLRTGNGPTLLALKTENRIIE